jgi:2-polyprenyl-3-methyl-5-hydroxy-6-metoxy-1,4-benzoquinol methylase
MEPLTEAETQLLIVLHSLSVRPHDRETGQVLEPTTEHLRKRAARYFEDKLLDWDEAYPLAVTKGFVTRQGSLVVLTESGAAIARELSEQHTSNEFSRFLLRSEASAAYSSFCQRVYGVDLCQFNMMDSVQLGKLLETLKLNSKSRVLDLGCGIGLVTEHISDQTGAHVLGVDLAAGAIARAQERTESKRHRLEFRVENLNRLDPALGGVDTIVAIDSLYFADDLESTVNQIKRLLRDDGQLGIFYSQMRWTPDLPDDVLTPEGTKLARLLLKAGFVFETWEYTTEELQLWRKQREVAEALKDLFVAEGNQELYESRMKESSLVVGLLEEGKGRRYLYHARPAGGVERTLPPAGAPRPHA